MGRVLRGVLGSQTRSHELTSRAADRLQQLNGPIGKKAGSHPVAAVPPAPPTQLTADLALDPASDSDLLWHIARSQPTLRRWLIANPAASPELLEYVSQAGGPGVRQAFAVLFDEDGG